MKREELARKLARETHQSSARAQDQLDGLVHTILKTLREGRAVDLPGVGKLVPHSPVTPAEHGRKAR